MRWFSVKYDRVRMLDIKMQMERMSSGIHIHSL